MARAAAPGGAGRSVHCVCGAAALRALRTAPCCLHGGAALAPFERSSLRGALLLMAPAGPGVHSAGWLGLVGGLAECVPCALCIPSPFLPPSRPPSPAHLSSLFPPLPCPSLTQWGVGRPPQPLHVGHGGWRRDIKVSDIGIGMGTRTGSQSPARLETPLHLLGAQPPALRLPAFPRAGVRRAAHRWVGGRPALKLPSPSFPCRFAPPLRRHSPRAAPGAHRAAAVRPGPRELLGAPGAGGAGGLRSCALLRAATLPYPAPAL